MKKSQIFKYHVFSFVEMMKIIQKQLIYEKPFNLIENGRKKLNDQ